MSDDREFAAWKRARTSGEVPGGFADRVMARIDEGDHQRRTTGFLLLLAAVARSRAGLGVATALAAAVFLYRAVCSFGVFITG